MAIPEKLVVNLLRKEYSAWLLLLTDEEKHAIQKYSYNSIDKKSNSFFKRLNAMLRGDYNDTDKELLEEYAKRISYALKKHPLEHDIVCYRGSDDNPVEGLKVGTIFSLCQFTSTSVVRTKALSKKYKIVILAPKGTNGAYIEGLSAFPKQREFLIDKDCYYKLVSVKNDYIKLEVSSS